MDKKAIGKLIKEKRIEKEMTQAQLYRHLPIQDGRPRATTEGDHSGRATIARIEKGYWSLKIEQFVALARALGYSPSELLKELEEQGEE